MPSAAFDLPFQQTLARESWSLYAVGALFVVARTYARIHRVGLGGLQPDDYLMFAALGWFTTLVVCLNVVVTGGGSNLFPPEQLSTFTPADIEERIKGSKVVVISEQAMLNTIYFNKACMLIMYRRLTMGLRQQRMVKAIAVYVALGWFGTELAFFFACRPFKGYWAVPPPDPQCTTLQHYSITQGVFNISSDLMMLGVMLPLLAQTNLPSKQKVVLVGIFSMGSFVIVAAILTKVFNLGDVYSTIYMLWYIREASVAIYVANLPLIWPLLREWFPHLRVFTPGHRSTSSNRKTGNTGSSLCGMRRTGTDGGGSHPMSRISKNKCSQYTMGTETDIERTGSVERINKPPFDGHGILAETTVNIEVDGFTSSADDLDSEENAQMQFEGQSRAQYDWEMTDPRSARKSTNISAKEIMFPEESERRREQTERENRGRGGSERRDAPARSGG
ncbi:hypothetical protein GJ744_011487 [Endocarpon pusillum]|uniref:Rhodopsin domain-containing protein n=1 Tax=Endocarpon pusillum TaxID=364733 RepID=A0A8H7ACM6_9EURO|nr:hypothetical protein GJ744_011487 [Endocarpon pusillum]